MNPYFDTKEHTGRKFDDIKGLLKFFGAHKAIVWSWAIRGFATNAEETYFRFRVSGHLHKGYVYVTVNGSDLFDVYLTTLQGKIKSTITDVYLDQLIDTIDTHVERIPQYKD